MNAYLNKGEYVFVTVTENEAHKVNHSDVLGRFKESEGLTLIVKQAAADQLNFTYESVFAWITLKVHSSLEAVGLTATFSSELAKHNISCNAIAGYYHDHIFVNTEDAPKAIQVLNELSKSHSV